MHVIEDIDYLKMLLKATKLSNKTIGFVPTMGALHEGHISLLTSAKSETEFTVVSIFVNPTQFTNPDDLIKYPRTQEADIMLLKNAGCDVVFIPKVSDMYPNSTTLQFNFGYLETIMEGTFRPGHFNGVATVVSKLFNVVQPDIAYFGQKDLQQCAVIQTLIKDLFFPIKMVIAPILREKSNLAMSSRNKRLSENQLLLAPKIYEALKRAEKQFKNGVSIETNKNETAEFLNSFGMNLEYIEFVNPISLLAINEDDEKIAICIAAYLGEIRLIDNIIFEKM